VLPKTCPICMFMRPPKLATCPACGFKPEPKCDVVNNDGELVEFVSRRVAKEPTEEDRSLFYAELRWMGRERGYKPGWAAQQFRNRYGHYPPWSWNDMPVHAPSLSTLSWIRSRQIAFAKRRSA
jgi:DNA repair protein RadD